MSNWCKIPFTGRPSPERERQYTKGQSNPRRELQTEQRHQSPRRVWKPAIQENGQRKYGPPADWERPPPPRGTEVFVSRLPRHCKEDVPCPVFNAVGNIYELRLMMDFSGTNRGYGFVKYATPDMAIRAIPELHDTRIGQNSVTIIVEESLDNCKLFVSPIPANFTNEDI